MVISTRGRYALRLLLDLAEHADEGFVSLKDIAERQDISLKYVEQLMPQLIAAGMLDTARGKSGGYKLARKPDGPGKMPLHGREPLSAQRKMRDASGLDGARQDHQRLPGQRHSQGRNRAEKSVKYLSVTIR